MNLLNPKILISFILAAALLLIPASGISKNVTKNLAKAQFTTHIVKRNPANNIKRIDTAYKSV